MMSATKKLIVYMAVTFALWAFASFVLLTLGSCTPYYNNLQGYAEGQHLALNEAWLKTSSYPYIDEDGEYWKSPIEFERDGGGDCEDFCVYLMYQLGNRSELVMIRYDMGYHAVVRWEGRYLEPQVYGLEYPARGLKIINAMNYGEVMDKATHGGAKGEL
jgi:hypothetical protein